MPGYIHSHVAVGASAAAQVFKPAADAEVQPYNNATTGILVGTQANVTAPGITAATAQTLYNLQITQESSYIFPGTVATAAIPVGNASTAGAPAAGVHPAKWDSANKIMARDQDLVAYVNGPGSDVSTVIAHMAYGQNPPPWPAGKLIYLVDNDASDSATASWDEISTSPINDLDPQKMYALVGGCAMPEDANINAGRWQCPSFNGLKPAVIGGTSITWFRDMNGTPCCAGIFSGAESLTLEVYNNAAQKCVMITVLIEIGATAAVPSGPSIAPVRAPGGASPIGVGPVFGRIGKSLFG